MGRHKLFDSSVSDDRDVSGLTVYNDRTFLGLFAFSFQRRLFVPSISTLGWTEGLRPRFLCPLTAGGANGPSPHSQASYIFIQYETRSVLHYDLALLLDQV